MSKTHTRKSNVTSMATGHFTDRSGAEESNAPVGLAPTTPEQVSGPTVFDVVGDLSSVGQIVILRSIANSAIIQAVYSAHDALVLRNAEDSDDEKIAAATARLARSAQLYSHATTELGTLAQNRFDQPMTLAEAVDFAANSATERKPEELPAEVLEALGITAEQLKLIDAVEQQKAAQRASRLRESIRENVEGITAEVNSFIGTFSDIDVTEQLTAPQHQALLRKGVEKLQAQMSRLIGMRSRYSAALGEAMLIGQDVKAIDKALVQFTRANIGELRDAA